MAWQKRVKPEIEVGDRVTYSREFLRNTGQFTGDIPFACGTVESIADYGSTRIAAVDWGNPDIPAKVNVANLVREKQVERE